MGIGRKIAREGAIVVERGAFEKPPPGFGRVLHVVPLIAQPLGNLPRHLHLEAVAAPVGKAHDVAQPELAAQTRDQARIVAAAQRQQHGAPGDRSEHPPETLLQHLGRTALHGVEIRELACRRIFGIGESGGLAVLQHDAGSRRDALHAGEQRRVAAQITGRKQLVCRIFVETPRGGEFLTVAQPAGPVRNDSGMPTSVTVTAPSRTA